ncbi:Uncharacterised protein [Vibrio cholerae]|nr:Uncharacterised protein [Vibrio cholerae]
MWLYWQQVALPPHSLPQRVCYWLSQPRFLMTC